MDRYTLKPLIFSISPRHTTVSHMAIQICLPRLIFSRNTLHKALDRNTITHTSPISRIVRWVDQDQRRCMDTMDIRKMATCLDNLSTIFLNNLLNNIQDLR